MSKQRLVKLLADQQSLDRFKRTLAADLRVHLLQGRGRLGNTQEMQQIWQDLFQRAIKGQYLADNFGSLITAVKTPTYCGDAGVSRI